MKKGDFLVIAFGLFLAFSLFYFQKSQHYSGNKRLVIMIDGQVEKSIDLTDSLTDSYLFQTRYGENLVKIKEGEVSMEKADCRDQICVHHKHISEVGEFIICLPNRMNIEIQGTDDETMDTINY